VGKAHQFEPLRAWFGALYEVLLGQTQGPRFGSFVELYGIAETRAMIARSLGLEPDDEKAPKPGKKAASKAGA
jgi:lysyl-tRNA synthetase, class I